MLVHKTRSRINTKKIVELREQPVPGVTVTDDGDYYFVNLHAGQFNAGTHSRNLRGAPVYTQYSDVVKLFQRIRDESHRFAVSYHTVLKRQKQTASMLEEIPGIGPATRRKLIRTFGSLRGVEQADETALVAAIGATKAKLVRRYIKTA